MSIAKESDHTGLILQVAVPSPLFSSFDYKPPQRDDSVSLDSNIGVRVLVPFGRRKVVGILLAVKQGSSIEKHKLKHAEKIIDQESVFTPAVYDMLIWSANYYQHPIGEVFASSLPARLRTGNSLSSEESRWSIATDSTAASNPELGRAKKQRALFDFIQQEKSVNRKQVVDAGFTISILNSLMAKGLITSYQLTLQRDGPFITDGIANEQAHELNPDQQVAVDSISAKLDRYSCFLLDGVTGSGKTEVYMRAMQAQLLKGKQCLVLVPEIGLTPQTIERFTQRFNCPIAALHSGLNDTERLNAWSQALHGEAGIIIGTRSAVFTPMLNPGLIIVDEEHDGSFKQQDGFRYSARDLAVIRARSENVCVLLGSATPSLESIHNANTQKFTHLKLKHRAGSAQPATMELIDVSEQSLECGFSEQLLYKIETHLKNDSQILVFINRRGYAPVLSCQSCGWIAECDSCIANFTVHSNPVAIRCHHCGTRRSIPKFCPTCKSRDLNTHGMGTQKIEQFLTERFLSTPVIRIDRDSTRNKNSLSDLLSEVDKGEPCLLIGTQMLAKGHHFPNITLVAVVDADAGLFSADFRGQEHMAQTIIQVAGRAGRAKRSGEVVIQSRHCGHGTLQSICQSDYGEFVELILAERKAAAMPPFSYLALLKAEAADMATALRFLTLADRLVNELKTSLGIPVERIGPLPAPMEKRANRYRTHLTLKCVHRAALQELLKQLMPELVQLKQPAKLRWSLDVDPQDLI